MTATHTLGVIRVLRRITRGKCRRVTGREIQFLRLADGRQLLVIDRGIAGRQIPIPLS